MWKTYFNIWSCLPQATIALNEQDQLRYCSSFLPFIQRFFSHRLVRAKYQNLSSESYYIICGVPHGILLGPAIFLAIINGFLQNTFTSHFLFYFTVTGVAWAIPIHNITLQQDLSKTQDEARRSKHNPKPLKKEISFPTRDQEILLIQLHILFLSLLLTTLGYQRHQATTVLDLLR